MRKIKTIYKIEVLVAIVAIFAVGLFLSSMQPTFTGYISGVNLTVYSQDLDLIVDGSQSYTLTTAEETLHLKSFMLVGEMIGKGRAEILLDNGKGQQYLVYDDVEKKPELGPPYPITGIGITGQAIKEGETTEKTGVWLIVQPKKPVEYEFLPLAEDERVVEGPFYSVCKETCNMPEFLFNSHTYELIFRLEQGTMIKLKKIKYTLHE